MVSASLGRHRVPMFLAGRQNTSHASGRIRFRTCRFRVTSFDLPVKEQRSYDESNGRLRKQHKEKEMQKITHFYGLITKPKRLQIFMYRCSRIQRLPGPLDTMKRRQRLPAVKKAR